MEAGFSRAKPTRAFEYCYRKKRSFATLLPQASVILEIFAGKIGATFTGTVLG